MSPSMSDTEPPPSQTLAERIESLCREVTPLAEEYEAAESTFKNNPHIRAMRHSRSALSLGFIMPSPPHLAAATASYLAAVPLLEELLPRLIICSERFAALESECHELLGEFLDGNAELRSEIFKHEQRATYLELFGLLGLIASLTAESDATLEYYVICLEQAKSDVIGSPEWADSISPFRFHRSPVRQEIVDGDGGSSEDEGEGDSDGGIEGEGEHANVNVIR